MKALALVFFASLLSGCGNFGDPVVEAPLQPPRIVYEASMTFHTGTLDARSVNSNGGPVTAFSVAPALPAGLSLDPLTGEVAGAAAAAAPEARYEVTARGPGGTGTAAFDLRIDDLVFSSGTAKPRIAYATPVFDTLGKAASHAAVSTGGPVTAYAIHPALPAGLSLNATTGRISGTPTAVRAANDYTIIASGPGGRDTAVVRVAVAASFARPDIAYATPVQDTAGLPARHVPRSTGGPVASYALLLPQDAPGDAIGLPAGMSLDPATGVISGTPTARSFVISSRLSVDTTWDVAYRIVAVGPGGRDTAAIRIRVVQVAGIEIPSMATLQVSLHLDSISVPLSRLVIGLWSNVSADAPLFDTLWSGVPGVGTLGSIGQTLARTYAVKPLRNWTVTAVAYASDGSPYRAGSVTAQGMRVGETRAVSVGLSSIVIDSPPLVDPLP